MIGARRRRRTHKPVEPDRGAAAVEFALVSLLLFLLLFGIIEFGLYFAQNLALSNGARQGARYGVVPNTDSAGNSTSTCAAITTEVQDASGTIGVSGPNVQVRVELNGNSSPPICPYSSVGTSTIPCASASPGSSLTVTAKATTPVLVPLIFSGSTLTVKGQGVFLCEFGAP